MDWYIRNAGYKLCKSQMYMDDFKLFAKNYKELEALIQTVRTYSQGMGMEFGTEKCTFIVRKNG